MSFLFNYWIASLLITISFTASAGIHIIEPKPEIPVYQCPPQTTLQKFLRFNDLALGEHHGTSEIPAFIKCLVDYSIESQDERVIVSLEMPSSAREPMTDFWRKSEHEDGRSSKAMHKLVKHLVDLENQLLIDLHFQHRTRYFETQKASHHFSKHRAKLIGLEIKELSQKGKLIALAGNIHTMKHMPKSFAFDLDFEGRYFGSSFTHILLESALGGSTWSCQPECGVQTHHKFKNVSKDSFVIDEDRGHDYIYYLTDRFGASPPSD